MLEFRHPTALEPANQAAIHDDATGGAPCGPERTRSAWVAPNTPGVLGRDEIAEPVPAVAKAVRHGVVCVHRVLWGFPPHRVHWLLSIFGLRPNERCDAGICHGFVANADAISHRSLSFLRFSIFDANGLVLCLAVPAGQVGVLDPFIPETLQTVPEGAVLKGVGELRTGQDPEQPMPFRVLIGPGRSSRSRSRSTAGRSSPPADRGREELGAKGRRRSSGPGRSRAALRAR